MRAAEGCLTPLSVCNPVCNLPPPTALPEAFAPWYTCQPYPILCSFPPRYSIAQVVTRFKSLSARAIFEEFSRIKRRLWGGEFWEDGYCVQTVGDTVSTEVIRRYIQHHRTEKAGDPQLKLFEGC